MRVRGWHIDGFGIHRDWRVDGIGPGMTVFHGGNETGKTTLLAFLRGVLFGYPKGNTNEPKYPPLAGGRHGGRVHLESERGCFVVERFAGRGQKVALTLEDGRPGTADDLAERLGHADARLFRNVYAFGLGELQQLETLGDSGVQDHLLSAGVTGAGRSARQATRELREAARELFAGERSRKRDRVKVLTEAIAERRAELYKRQEAAECYPDLRDHERRLAARLDELRGESERARVAERRARRLVELWNEVWSPLADMREQAAKLAPGDRDPLPADAQPRFEAALDAIRRDRERLEAVRGERQVLGAQLDGLHLDEGLRAVAPRVEALHDQLALHRSQRLRLEEIDSQRRACDERRAAILEQLGEGFGDDALRGFGSSAARSDVSIAVRRDELRGWKRRLEAAREVLSGAVAECLAAERDAPPPARPGALVVLLALLAAGLAAVAVASGRVELLLPAALAAGGSALGWRSRARAAASLRRQAAGRRSALAQVQREARESVLEVERGFDDWKRGLGLPSHFEPAEAADFLEDVRRARELLDEAGRLDAARARVAGDVRDWETRVDDVLADAPPAEPPGSPAVADRGQRLRALRARCEADRAAREQRRPLEVRAAELRQRFADADTAFAGSRAVLAGLLEECGADDADDLQRRLAARDQAEALARRIAAGEADLERRVEGAHPDEARLLAEELPRGRVAEWEELAREARARAARVQEERDQVLREHQDARQALVRLEESCDVVDLELVKAGLEQELREVVDEWRRLQLSSRLVEVALERFEGRHQPGVLREAGRLFAQVTDGRYPRIVQSDEDAGFSVLTADGVHRSPRELSRGTAEQLYLCVRLGLVAELSRARAPLPVVMDDVLVNFDDERAAAMAGVLATFAADHQLFFFTCSTRARDLLLSAGPGVALRSLDAGGAAS